MNSNSFDSPPSVLRSGRQKRSTSSNKTNPRAKRSKNNSCPSTFNEPRISAYYPVTPKQQTTPTSNRFSPLASLMENQENDHTALGVQATCGTPTPPCQQTAGANQPGQQNGHLLAQRNAQPMSQTDGSSSIRPLPNLDQMGSSSVTFPTSPDGSNRDGPPPGLDLQQRPATGMSQAHTQYPHQQQMVQTGQMQAGQGSSQMQNNINSGPQYLSQQGSTHGMPPQGQVMQHAGPQSVAQTGNGQGATYYHSAASVNGAPQNTGHQMHNAQQLQTQQYQPPPQPSKSLKRAYPGDDPLMEARFMAIEHNAQQGHITQNKAEAEQHETKIRICPCPYREPASHEQLKKWYKDTLSDKFPTPPGIDLCPPSITFQQVNLPNPKGPKRGNDNVKMVVTAEFPTALAPNFYKSWKWGPEGKGGLQLIAEAHKNYERVEKAKGDVNDFATNGFCLPKTLSVRPQLTTRHNLCCKYVKDLIRVIVKVMQERDSGNTSVGAPWMNKSSGRLPQLQPAHQGQDLKIRTLITPASDGNYPVYRNDFISYDQLQTDSRTAQYTTEIGRKPTNIVGKIVDFKKKDEFLTAAQRVLDENQRQLSPAYVHHNPNPPNQGYSNATFVNNDPNIPPVTY